MPSYSQILKEVRQQPDPLAALETKRLGYIHDINTITDRNIIAYYSGWLKAPNVSFISIDDNDKNAFMNAVYGMDRSKGLDLILHTPGGDLAATESIVSYLKQAFGDNIRAIIPQISMSAGTMIAMSCREIIMGRQSSLGPIDPQMNGIACQAVIDEFERAKLEVSANPAILGLWQTIISKYHPTFLTACEDAINWSKDLATQWLQQVNPTIDMKAVMDTFLDHSNSYSHARHISKDDCRAVGLNVTDLESNQALQEAVLSLHHCYMILLDNAPIAKIVENQDNQLYIQNYQARP